MRYVRKLWYSAPTLLILFTLTAPRASGQTYLVPVGGIVPYAGRLSALPANWMLCNGAELQTANFPELFNSLGTRWGGNGATTFRLPDLMGRFLRGVDSTANRDPDHDKRTPAATMGAPGNTVGSVQEDATALPKTPFRTATDGEHSHGGWVGDRRGSHPNGSDAPNPDGAQGIPAGGAHTHVVNAGGDNETRPVNAYVYWIIRVK